jgi:SpoIID/LytB domain protein
MKRRGFLSLLVAACTKAAVRPPEPPPDAPPPEPPSAGPPPSRELFLGAPAPDDPLELLYSRRLSFDEGQPLITVRVAEGRQQIAFAPGGALSVFRRSEKGEHVPAVERGESGTWTIRLLESSPGIGAAWVELEQLRFEDKQAVQRAREEWAQKGVTVRVATVGEAYGIAGHVVDTRRYAILAEGDATEEGARRQAQELEAKLGIRLQIHRELATRPRGRIELRDPKGASVAVGESALELRSEKGLSVLEVEHGMGYSFHGFETRKYPGRLFATVDASGGLALVAALPMERLVKGVVPSEIFPKAHLEALKAQAVTARGEVLAKIGARHLGDPYLLCAEQHCQVYKGIATEEAGPDAAVEATQGEALFAGNRKLVDSVYSAVCGGFTEDNDAVWSGPADPSLRGRPDFDLRAPGMAAFADGIGDALVSRFVHLNPVLSYCALSGLAKPEKLRWRKSFTHAEVDEICAHLGVGAVRAMAVEGRGVSGRARSLRIEGTKATARVYGELPIRRLFRNLNSGMFILEKSTAGWAFVGGGWGHGSGMCQTGAIGRAQRGAGYREILGWYYSGASPVKIY